MENNKDLKYMLGNMPKYKMSIFGSFKLFIKLLFLSIKKHKINRKIFFVELITASSFAIIFVSSSYIINSSNITMGDYLYPIKTDLQNIVSSTKVSNLSKIKYYNNLINQKLDEIKNIQSKNIKKDAQNNTTTSTLFINTVYAAEVNTSINTKVYSKTAIAETMKDIKNLKDKTILEIKKLKNPNELKQALDIFNNTINREIEVLENLASTSINDDQDTKEIKDIINTTSRSLDIAYRNKEQINSIYSKINTSNTKNLSEIKIDLTTDILENSFIDPVNKDSFKKYIEDINNKQIDLKNNLLKKGFSEKASENIMMIIENKLIDSKVKYNNGNSKSAEKDLKDAEFIINNPNIFNKNNKNNKIK